MARYKLTIEYDGTGLIGWQENSTGTSVQSLLSDAIFAFCGMRPDIVAAGRTDAGVHALGMVCHIDISNKRQETIDAVRNAINFYLREKPVCVLDCEIVPDDFHARFSCKRRNYKYVILNRSAPAVLNKNRVWRVARPLDVLAMQSAAKKFIGEHDWTSFRASECQAKSPIKTLDEIRIMVDGSRLIVYVSARSFLHHQVRNIVGTLVEIGLGKPMDIDEIFAVKNRSSAGPTAPASGLYFVSAEY